MSSRQRFEVKQGGPTAQRCIDFEKRILGCGPNKNQQTALYGRQQCILLRSTKPVNLVDEHHGATLFFTKQMLRLSNGLTNVFHTR